MEIKNIRINYERNPLGIEPDGPVFSWELAAVENNVSQSAYRIIVAADDGTLWDSGRIGSDETLCIPYAGKPLQSRTRYTVTVNAWDQNNSCCAAESWFETALTDRDWQADWIEPNLPAAMEEQHINITQATMGTYKKTPPETRLRPASCLRREFRLSTPVKTARLYVAVHGIYRLEINNQVPDDRFWGQEYTPYPKDTKYQVYDVTAHLREGDNALGVTIADGWWCGRFGMTGASCNYGDRHGLLLQLEMELTDGTRQVLCSDENFKASAGPVRYADLFIGEKYDANAELPGWTLPGFDDSAWKGVRKADYDYSILHPQTGAPVKVVREISARAVLTTPKGDTVVDLGENIAGSIRVSIRALKGTLVTLEYAEVLTKEGNFTHNIMGRNKDQTDIYICKGGGEVFEPRFTFHGYRYVRVSGLREVKAEDFTGLFLSSVDEGQSRFHTSDERLNRLQENILRSQLANMISIPTDCPQRERAGWTGDLQVFFRTAAFNRDLDTFLSRWLNDAALEQLPDGQIPHIVPYTGDYRELARDQFKSDSSSGWGDAAVIVPMGLYELYGDKRTLQHQFDSMRRWVDYIERQAREGRPKRYKAKNAEEEQHQNYLWNTGFHYGDHLIPSVTKKLGMMAMFGIKKTHPVVGTAYYAQSARMVAEAAEILDRPEDAAHYQALHEKAKAAFQNAFIGEDGRMKPDWQSSYILALGMGLVPEHLVDKCLDRLETLIEKNGGCHDCGFLSIQYLLDVFSKNGRADRAFQLLFQDKCPSWLYEVKTGATTIWEDWGAVKLDGKTGSFSYNHYAFGCVGDWMYRNLLGIRNAGTGYDRIRIAPLYPDELTQVSGCYQSVRGPITAAWEKEGNRITLCVELPANTQATVQLPDGSEQTIGSGKYKFECERGAKSR